MKIVETFTPASGPVVRCTSTKTLPAAAQGQIDFTSSDKSKKLITVTLNQTATANTLYLAVRNKTCKTPSSVPVDSSDYSGFGSVSIPVSAIGGPTITATLHNNLKPPSYPSPATGRNGLTAAVTFTRKG